MDNTLNIALQNMPVQFTSNEFVKTYLKLGGDQKEVDAGMIVHYLRQHCTQTTRRSWEKKEGNHTLFSAAEPELTDEKCIQHLKATGRYKILKLVEI